MLVACWSVKGGSGTSTIAASLALVLARSTPTGVLLLDLAGDLPSVLGLPSVSGPGVSDWLAAGSDVPSGALAQLGVDPAPGLRLVPWVASDAPAPPPWSFPGDAGERLAAALDGEARTVVVDCGSAGTPLGTAVAAAASLSLLVLRPCYLGLRRAAAAPVRPSGVVLVGEPWRVLGADDVTSALGVPVRATVRWDDAVARAVDVGLLATRMPRGLARALAAAA